MAQGGGEEPTHDPAAWSPGKELSLPVEHENVWARRVVSDKKQISCSSGLKIKYNDYPNIY